jgi:uncharacterized protein YprB with RNaseH-like and TPR domain
MEGSVLIFDIETTGLRLHDSITVICAIEQEINNAEICREHRFNVLEVAKNPELGSKLCKAFLGLMDGASKLVAYNGIAFDIPFVIRWANSHGLVVDKYAWESKTIDFYKIILRQTGTHFKMQKLCECNELAVSKSGTGLEAVQWAKEGKWEKLMRYCMQDVIVLRTLMLRACAQGLCISILREQSSAYDDAKMLLRLCNGMKSVYFEREDANTKSQVPEHTYKGVVEALCQACEDA